MKFAPVMAASAALFVISVAGSAAAQTPGNPQMPRVPEINNTLRFGGSAGDYQNRLAAEARDRDREGFGEPTEQELLIERITPLVPGGPRNAAREIARQEGDRALSRRIGQVCVEGRPTEIPEAEAAPAG